MVAAAELKQHQTDESVPFWCNVHRSVYEMVSLNYYVASAVGYVAHGPIVPMVNVVVVPDVVNDEESEVCLAYTCWCPYCLVGGGGPVRKTIVFV